MSREIQEELDVSIMVGEFQLQEHSAARWLTKETLYDVDWLEADLPIVECVGKLI